MTLFHMKYDSLRVAIGLALGVASMGPQMASAAIVVPDGNYTMTIVAGKGTTPAGTDGNWNSSFTFGCTPVGTGCSSQSMTDNGTNNIYTSGAAAGTAFGSGVGADGVAGTINMAIVGGVITSVSSFHVDMIKSTAGGNFVQYAPSTALMGGSINTATGAMTFDPTGRLGSVQGYDTLYDKPWNNQPSSSIWNTFSTVSATAPGCTLAGSATTCTIHGAALTGPGGTAGYSGILVSGGNVGSNWGGFNGNPYFEAWKINLVQTVPVPAAAWLFGSGLLGLVGVARRKKT